MLLKLTQNCGAGEIFMVMENIMSNSEKTADVIASESFKISFPLEGTSIECVAVTFYRFGYALSPIRLA